MNSITVKENVLFQRWAKTRAKPFMQDGVPFPDDYKDSSVRTIFVFREANHGPNPQSEDLRLHIRTNPREDFWLQKVSPWCHGLMNYTRNSGQTWEERRSDPLKALRPFGFIQIKKVPGGANSVHRDVKQFAQENALLLRKQLSIYSPNVIIACGVGGSNVFDLLLETVLFEAEKQVWNASIRRLRYAEIRDPTIAHEPFFLIENHHPSSRRNRFEVYKELIASFRKVMTRRLVQ